MYNNVLMAVDLNDADEWRAALAVSLEQLAEGGTLHLVTVVPEFGMSIVGQYFPKGYENEVGKKVKAELETAVAEQIPVGTNHRCHVYHGTIYKMILKAASKLAVDLVVVAAGREDLKDYLLGPNAARIVRHAQCSVLVVR